MFDLPCNTKPDHPKMIRLKAVLALTGLKKTATYDSIKRGLHPAGIRLTRRCVVWNIAELGAWIEERAAAAKAARAAGAES